MLEVIERFSKKKNQLKIKNNINEGIRRKDHVTEREATEEREKEKRKEWTYRTIDSDSNFVS